MLNATAGFIETTPAFPLYEDEKWKKRYIMALLPRTRIRGGSGEPDATLVLSGAKLEKLFQMTNFDHEETVMRFARQLRAMGVDEALRARGAKDGDIVRIGNFEFEFVE